MSAGLTPLFRSVESQRQYTLCRRMPRSTNTLLNQQIVHKDIYHVNRR